MLTLRWHCGRDLMIDKTKLGKAEKVFTRELRERAIEINGINELVSIPAARIAYTEAMIGLCKLVLDDIAKETEQMSK